jgi:predicted RNA binding protein YcfA (HicA-like mRNA interferase family)
MAMKNRDLVKRLYEMGAKPLWTTGSHQMWELPNDGGRIPVVVDHRNSDVTRNVMASLKRKLRTAGLSL